MRPGRDRAARRRRAGRSGRAGSRCPRAPGGGRCAGPAARIRPSQHATAGAASWLASPPGAMSSDGSSMRDADAQAAGHRRDLGGVLDQEARQPVRRAPALDQPEAHRRLAQPARRRRARGEALLEDHHRLGVAQAEVRRRQRRISPPGPRVAGTPGVSRPRHRTPPAARARSAPTRGSRRPPRRRARATSSKTRHIGVVSKSRRFIDTWAASSSSIMKPLPWTAGSPPPDLADLARRSASRPRRRRCRG